MAPFGMGYRWHCTGLTHDENGAPTSKPSVAEALTRRLYLKIENRTSELADYFAEQLEDCDLAVVSFGSSAMASLSAVRRARNEGYKVGMLRLKTIWPFPTKTVKSLLAHAKKILVPEMNLGQLALEIERSAGCGQPVIRLGKANGELFHPDEVFAAIKEAL
jgi:2-oxoglutarate ferredoxin oxidoreductase subunit alpha